MGHRPLGMELGAEYFDRINLKISPKDRPHVLGLVRHALVERLAFTGTAPQPLDAGGASRDSWLARTPTAAPLAHCFFLNQSGRHRHEDIRSYNMVDIDTDLAIDFTYKCGQENSKLHEKSLIFSLNERCISIVN